MQHGRGVVLADFNRDGKTDIVYGNWNGPHRLYMQMNNRKQKFKVGPHVFAGYSTAIYAHSDNSYTKNIVSISACMFKQCIMVKLFTLKGKVKRQTSQRQDK